MKSLWGRVRAAGTELAGIWRYAIARRELDVLDDVTLRDLGIRRSELDSCVAESLGRSEPSRTRIIRRLGAGAPT